MPREYKKIKHFEKEILALQADGRTYKEIGEIYGFSREQVRELVKRYRRKIHRNSDGISALKRRGRPRKKPLITQGELEHEIKRLGMENELLRSFLQAAGRR